MSELNNHITFIILTHNEEVNLLKCINSIKKLSENIIVIDSYSDDNTEEICKKSNVSFFQNKFYNQGTQFNWALDNTEIKTKWIMRLDADEYFTDNLIENIKKIDFSSDKIKAYSMNKRIYWMNKWLKHGGLYPMKITRLFIKNYARYEEVTEENLVVNGKIKDLNKDLVDDNKKNNVSFFTKKHLITGEGEMKEYLGLLKDSLSIDKDLFGEKPERTRWLKLNLYNKAPLFFRCFGYFIYRYIFRLGFLDGKEGLIFHVLQGFWYRFLIDSLIYENKKKRN
jgi:glycosyltransferase involved in cell wall biosynthesis